MRIAVSDDGSLVMSDNVKGEILERINTVMSVFELTTRLAFYDLRPELEELRVAKQAIILNHPIKDRERETLIKVIKLVQSKGTSNASFDELLTVLSNL